MAALKKIRLKKHKVNSATSNDRLTEIKFEWLFSSVLFKNHCYNKRERERERERECRKIVDSSCRGFWNSQISLIGLRNLLILQIQILLQRIHLSLCTDSHTQCFTQIHWDRSADLCPLVLRLESIFYKCNVCQERSYLSSQTWNWIALGLFVEISLIEQPCAAFFGWKRFLLRVQKNEGFKKNAPVRACRTKKITPTWHSIAVGLR